MSRCIRWMSVALCLLLMAPRSSNAQFAVYDDANWERNLITSLQMLLQVANSDQEVQAMIQNLLVALGQRTYPLGDLEALLMQVSQAAGPRSMSARNLDYVHPDLSPTMKEYFFGYTPLTEPIWPDLYGRNVDTALNTMESIIAQSYTEAGPESDLRYDGTHDALYGRNEGSIGALQAQQTGNAIALFGADSTRQLVKVVAGTNDLIATRNAHDLHREAVSEVMLEQALEKAGGKDEAPVLYGSGAGNPGATRYVWSRGGLF